MNKLKRFIKKLFSHNCNTWKVLYSITRREITDDLIYETEEYKCSICGKIIK